MLTLTTLATSTAAAMGLAAMLAKDPVVIGKATVAVPALNQGYSGELVSKALRERIRGIANAAGTSRGDSLGVFDDDESALEVLAEKLRLDGVVDAIQEYFNLHAYSISMYMATTETGYKLTLKGRTKKEELFFITVKGNDIDKMLTEMAERFVERADPYVLTLYYFRKEYASGEFVKVKPLIEHTIRVLPTELKIWPLLLSGRVHYREGRYEEAIERYRTALQLDPNFAIAEARWGEALLAMGDHEGAITHMQHALTLVRRGEAPERQRASISPVIHYLLGDTLVKLGYPEKARDVFVLGLKVTPRHPGLESALASLYLQREQFDPAISLLRDALIQKPGQPQIAKMLDEALSRKLGTQL